MGDGNNGRGKRSNGTPPGDGASGNGKWSKYPGHKSISGISWDACDAAVILAAIHAITRDGDAVLFSCTRSGDCLVLTICAGEDRRKFYGREPEEMNSELVELAHWSE